MVKGSRNRFRTSGNNVDVMLKVSVAVGSYGGN